MIGFISRNGAYSGFLFLYAALYAGFGVLSPFLPAYLQTRGLSPQELAIVLAAGTAIRIVAGPLAGRMADLLQAPRGVLAVCTAGASLGALLYLSVTDFAPVLVVYVLESALLAPLAPLSDSLALASAKAGRLDYGRVRGAGSVAFIAGMILSSQAAAAVSSAAIAIWLNACLLALAIPAALCVPNSESAPPLRSTLRIERLQTGWLRQLFGIPAYRRAILVAALVLGSHALHDGFAIIRWRAAGLSVATGGLLWSESVAAEIIVFFVAGAPLIARLGTGGAAGLAAAAGCLRWVAMAQTVYAPALALIEPLHGLSFALLHLAIMKRFNEIVPPDLSATAQSFYGNFAIGVATAALTALSGPLYASFGGAAFYFMAALCAIAFPFAIRIGRD
jgi:PPP family 3-phenylpropionic acid transporter